MTQRSFRKLNQKREMLTVEQKIEKFILRNSDNGYFTKISTISNKFNISEDRTWNVMGDLLVEGKIESIHDKFSGEMKLCRIGKIYAIMNSSQKRKKVHRKKLHKKPKKLQSSNDKGNVFSTVKSKED